MSYMTYKVLHVFAVMFLLTSLGVLAAAGAGAAGGIRKAARMAHGIALVVIFVAGFGLLARLGLFGGIPLWVWMKMGLWLVLGLAVLPLSRRPEWVSKLWFLIPVIGGAAAWLAIQKPF